MLHRCVQVDPVSIRQHCPWFMARQTKLSPGCQYPTMPECARGSIDSLIQGLFSALASSESGEQTPLERPLGRRSVTAIRVIGAEFATATNAGVGMFLSPTPKIMFPLIRAWKINMY